VSNESPKFPSWNDDDVERLLRLIESGSSVNEITGALGRSEVDVTQQARFLGVHLPSRERSRVLTRTSDSSVVSSTIRYAPFKQIPERAEV
jgi:hypothetical protein